MGFHVSAELRRIVQQRADHRCEYCRIPGILTFAPLEIDHIVSMKHGGATDESNLALSCSLCNKHKGSDIASMDQESGRIIPLFHPRKNIWTDHFRVQDTMIIPLTPEGKVTIRLLQLNADSRIKERRLILKILPDAYD